MYFFLFFPQDRPRLLPVQYTLPLFVVVVFMAAIAGKKKNEMHTHTHKKGPLLVDVKLREK